jgi:asparagine synthase (glutamine-hydrolysing)
MCGIAGLFQPAGVLADPERARATVARMTGTMVHRGPDAEGLWADPGRRCVLGHRRLSIIDTSDAGRQPMSNAQGRWVISFNGEIYNFGELRPELDAEGMPVRGRTDTEVLLQSLALWGLDALPRLDGMFAFAAFDRDRGELILARDPFGEKPLYWFEPPGGGLAFASELHALEQVPGFDAQVSADAMAEMLMFQYIGAPRTIYRNVHKLPPGHWLVARAGEPVKVGRYYEFRPGTHGFDERPLPELADELEALLVRSIRRRLIADVPLGAFLSGGVDSSTVCALIARRMGVPLKTFSIGFKDAPESEHEAARAFARHLGCEHHDQILSPEVGTFLEGIGRLLDEPNGDSSCMPTYLLAQFARQRVTVAVSGDGGDELFAGYGRYFTTLDEELALPARQRARFQAGSAYYAERILVSTERHIEELFGEVPPALAAHVSRLRTEVGQPQPPLFCRLRKTDVDNYLPGAVLPKVDRMSMQHSLEVRTPFLNLELARFAERLPLSVLYRPGRGKLILREVAYRYLPRQRIDAPKQGFGLPMSRWARGALLDVASNLLEQPESRLRQALGDAALGRFMQRQRAAFSAYQVWSLVTLESWLRHHRAELPQLAGQPKSRRVAAHPGAPALARDSLLAWPIAPGFFAVVEDPSLRLDAAEDASDAERQLRSNVEEMVLRMALQFQDQLPATPAFAPAMPATPVPLPAWGSRPLPDAIGTGLRGATLLYPEPEALKRLDSDEADKLTRLGVQRAVFFHPYRYDRSLVAYRFRAMSLRDRVRRARALWPKRVAAFSRWFARNDGGKGYWAGPLHAVAPTENVELAGRYMLFEGLRQLVPVHLAHDDIRQRGGGRYSVWSQRCFFAPPRRLKAWTRPYWLVEKTAEIERWLEISPEWSPPIEGDWHDFLRVVEPRLAREAALPRHLDLRPGDRVAIVTHGLPPGGAERQWCYLAAGLKQQGYEVHFLITGALHGPNAHYVPLLASYGIAPVLLGARPLADVIAHTPRTQDAARLLSPESNPFGLALNLLVSYLVQAQPKALFAQLEPVNLLAGMAGHLAEVPKVCLSFRNYNPSHFSYLDYPWFQPFYRALARSGRITLSGNSRAGNEDYARWIGVPPEEVSWIPNAIEPADFPERGADSARLRAELRIAEGQPVILGVFRLSEEKRPEVFVRVCAQVAQRIPNLRVLIVGVGPMQATVEQAIRGLDLDAQLLGRRDDVPDLMRVASLVLLASRHEGMPNVLMEAQLLGVPVVATRVGGAPDCVLDAVTGLLRDKDDVAGLAEACIHILRDRRAAARMSAQGSAYMRTYFTKERLASLHVQLVRDGPGKVSAAATQDAVKVADDAATLRSLPT